MMRLLVTCIFSFFLLVSCSSDDSGSNDTNDSNETIDPSENSITVDGVEFSYSQVSAVRSGDEFAIILANDESETISMSFHKNGNYGDIVYMKFIEGGDGFPVRFQTLDTYADRSFSFQILDIDDSSNSVSLKFEGTFHKEGYLYEEDDFNDETPREFTEQIETKATLNLAYDTVTPSVEGLEVSAFLNNEQWYSLDTDSSSSGLGFSDTVFSHYNNTKYSINLNLNEDNIVEGTYTFDQSYDGFNRIFLKEYVVENENVIGVEYLSEGTLTIESFDRTFNVGQLRATFSFTATHPETNEVISVTSGIFNSAFFL